MEPNMQQDPVVLYSTMAVTLVCVIMIVRTVLSYLGKVDAVKNLDHYKPFAIMAAKWVEKQVPDTFGAHAEDPSTARAVHKLDLFLQKFIEVTAKFDGREPSDALKAEAMKWSVELAERLNREKADAGNPKTDS